MIQELYNGSVQIELNEEAHCYTIIGTKAKPDGVTTILNLVPKYLLPWVARVTSEHISKGLIQRMERGEPIEISFILSLCEEAKKEHDHAKKKAGGIGTLVHAFAETAFKTGRISVPPKNAPEYAGCQAFLTWLMSADIDRTQMQSERIVFSERLFYAGKTDLFATINSRPAIVDLKTGSGFYDEQPLQLGAYALALEEELGIPIKDGWIIHLDKETGKCTPYYVEITDQLKTDWEAVRIAWRAVKRNAERVKQIKQETKRCQTSRNTIQAAAL